MSQVNELRQKRDGTLADLNAAMANLSKVTGEDDEETRDVIIKSDVRRDTRHITRVALVLFASPSGPGVLGMFINLIPVLVVVAPLNDRVS